MRHRARHKITSAATGADEPAPWAVHLPGFDGPLDLLLHLIERNQLEITTISLVAVTDQFIAYLRTWDEPPMPRLAEFVAMAARLLLIKSRSLLPRQPRQDATEDDSDPLDDAEQLRRHLLEYKLANEIAEMLRARELAGLQSFARPGRCWLTPMPCSLESAQARRAERGRALACLPPRADREALLRAGRAAAAAGDGRREDRRGRGAAGAQAEAAAGGDPADGHLALRRGRDVPGGVGDVAPGAHRSSRTSFSAQSMCSAPLATRASARRRYGRR